MEEVTLQNDSVRTKLWICRELHVPYLVLKKSKETLWKMMFPYASIGGENSHEDHMLTLQRLHLFFQHPSSFLFSLSVFVTHPSLQKLEQNLEVCRVFQMFCVCPPYLMLCQMLGRF